ncbi:MAG: aminodeoxychorismate synthase component I [Bacteroidota bacterium]
MRQKKSFSVEDINQFKKQLLNWSKQFESCVWLDSNSTTDQYTQFDAALAVDEFTSIKTDFSEAFEKLDEYQQTTKDWIFGYFSYDLKNDTEELISANDDGLKFPDLYFFQPQKIIQIKADKCEFLYLNLVADEMDSDWQEINQTNLKDDFAHSAKINLEAKLTQQEYISKVERVLQHIQRGDIYEMNFCQEFFATDVQIDAHKVFKKLNEISSPPFASFLKLEHIHCICASPERFIQKKERRIISQPIKGTTKRSLDKEEDTALKQHLETDEKEISENVMIVDLVRNDLSKTAQKASVQVEELCKVYSFKQVHQLISTISSRLKPEVSPVELIKTCFPMGSMTGAPKISAMQIIEEQEATKRGLYSGAIGYFSPTGDFDFNVVIRSILYNSQNNYLSYSVGSAITEKSVPEKEFDECLVKAAALKQVLSE